MKKLATAIAVTALIGTPAFAADMAVKAPAPAPAPVPSWTGFYIGAAVGAAWGNVNASEVPGDPATSTVVGGGPHLIVDPASTSFHTVNPIISGEAGYNLQFYQTLVAGIEADFSGGDMKGNGSSGVNMAAFGPNFATLNTNEKVEWFGTVRGRLGYLATNNLLLFGTGGFAYGRVDQAANVTVNPGGAIGFGTAGFSFACSNPPLAPFGGPTCFTGSHSQTSTGWTAGGGLEWQFASNLTFKVEYLYVNLGSSNTFNLPAASLFAGFGSPAFLRSNYNDVAFNVVRWGVNWRF